MPPGPKALTESAGRAGPTMLVVSNTLTCRRTGPSTHAAKLLNDFSALLPGASIGQVSHAVRQILAKYWPSSARKGPR